MAIGDILKSGTYSYIDEVYLNKNTKSYSFKFYVFENKDKEKLILEKYYSISCKISICKVVDKVYTSKDFVKDLKNDLYDFYYNNPKDLDYPPGIYTIKITNQYDGEVDKHIDVPVWNRNYSYNYIYFQNKYYRFNTTENTVYEINGFETDHFYDTVIYPSINSNIVEVLYNILLTEESSYKDYPKI